MLQNVSFFQSSFVISKTTVFVHCFITICLHFFFSHKSIRYNLHIANLFTHFIAPNDSKSSMKRFSPSKGDGRLPPLKAPRVDKPPRPLARDFNPPPVENADGAPARIIKLFFIKTVDSQTHVIYGIDDRGHGAYFTPFRDVAEDTSDEANEFRAATGCFGTHLNLTNDPEAGEMILAPPKNGNKPQAIQAILFYDRNNDPDFIDKSLDALVKFMNTSAHFTSTSVTGFKNNFVHDKHLSDESHLWHQDEILPLDKVLTAESVVRTIHYYYYRENLLSKYLISGKFYHLPPSVTKDFYKILLPVSLRNMYFSRRKNGAYHNIAVNTFGYPKGTS